MWENSEGENETKIYRGKENKGWKEIKKGRDEKRKEQNRIVGRGKPGMWRQR